MPTSGGKKKDKRNKVESYIRNFYLQPGNMNHSCQHGKEKWTSYGRENLNCGANNTMEITKMLGDIRLNRTILRKSNKNLKTRSMKYQSAFLIS